MLTVTIVANIDLIRDPNPWTVRTVLLLIGPITAPRVTPDVPRNRDLRRHHLVIIFANFRPVNEPLVISGAGDRTATQVF